MKILLLLVSVFSIILFWVIMYVAFKIVRNKSVPDNFYTPFDYITAQVPSEFHEEKEEEIEKENKQGDDKDK